MTQPITTAAIRHYLTAAYSDDELTALCADHFPAVSDTFAAGMTKTQKIHHLLDHCQRRDLLPNLRAALHSDRPKQYEKQFEPAAPTPAPAPPPPPRAPHPIFTSRAHEVDSLIAALADPDTDVRQAAAAGLAEIGVPAIEPLIATLGVWEYGAAIQALAQIGAPAVGPLIAKLTDPDATIRRGATEALGWIGNAQAIEALIAALADPDADVRKEASFALRLSKTPNAQAALKEYYAALLRAKSDPRSRP